MNDRACNSDNEIRTYSRKRLGNKARLRNVWSERNLVALFVSTTKDQKYLRHFLCHTTGMCFPLQISFFIYSLLKVRDDDALWNESPGLKTECHLISLILMPLHAIPFFPLLFCQAWDWAHRMGLTAWTGQIQVSMSEQKKRIESCKASNGAPLTLWKIIRPGYAEMGLGFEKSAKITRLSIKLIVKDTRKSWTGHAFIPHTQHNFCKEKNYRKALDISGAIFNSISAL